jgi:hypothetical protein
MSNEKNNPATGQVQLPKGYRPMSVGQRRLEVPAIEGFHLHWFRGNPSNLHRAHQAGYEFVDPDEVSLNDFDLAGGDEEKGTDLGSRVSVISGDDVGVNGQPGRLYLMKCPLVLYQYSQRLLGDQVDTVVDALKGGKVGVSQDGQETRSDAQNRYVKEAKSTLLTRKT